MDKNTAIGFVYNRQLPETKAKAIETINYLGLKNRTWISSAEDLPTKSDELQDTSVAIVFGGDGTILRTIRVTSGFEVPLVGIKMGKIGFMAELTTGEIKSLLPDYIFRDARIRVEKRMMLKAEIISPDATKPRLTVNALNDIAVGTNTPSRLVELQANVNDVHLTNYRADAVIIATATGSTGYALAAGGPIIFPEAELMILQPVAAHTGLRDGLILAPDSAVELKASINYRASISADGFVDSQLKPGEKVLVRQSPYKARFLRAHQPDFFYTALNLRLGLAYRSQRPPEDNG